MKPLRIKITSQIAITKPRSDDKMCLICGQKINSYAVIVYMLHGKDKLYSWLHFDCCKNISDDKTHKKIIGLFTLMVDERPILHSEKAGCSYCGIINNKFPLHNFVLFFLHFKCIEKLKKDLTVAILENEKELVLGAI